MRIAGMMLAERIKDRPASMSEVREWFDIITEAHGIID
jgi:hypothetical protein